MKIFDTIARWAARPKAATTTDREGWLIDWIRGGSQTASGVTVTPDKAMQMATVFACIRNISDDIGALPISVYSKDGDTRNNASDHPVSRMLAVEPNPEMTAVSLRSALQAHILGWGNGYCEIVRNIAGDPVQIFPIKPNRVAPYRAEDKRIWYEITLDNGSKTRLPSRNVLHIPGLGFDGIVGYNVVRYARESIGLGMAAEEFGNVFYGNGLNPSMVLSFPEALSDKARENLKRAIVKNNSGLKNAFKVMLLEEGAKAEKITIAPEEAQFLQTREFSVVEICRWFRMPPHMVADLSRATFSNIEHQAIQYVVNTLTPWLVRWEQEINRKLLKPPYYCKHNVQGLLRGDIQSRYRAYAVGRQWGWLNADEIREYEDMNPLPDGAGQEYLTPMNMSPAGQRDNDAAGGQRINNATITRMVSDCARRIFNAEMSEIDKHVKYAKFSPVKWSEWLSRFYESHAGYIEQVLEPIGAANATQSIIAEHLDLLVVTHDAAGAAAAMKAAGPAIIEPHIWRAMQ